MPAEPEPVAEMSPELTTAAMPLVLTTLMPSEVSPVVVMLPVEPTATSPVHTR